MGRNKYVTCRICCNYKLANEYESKLELVSENESKLEMGSEIKQRYKCWECVYSTNWLSNLRRQENAMHKPLVTGKKEYHSTVDVADLKNEIVWGANEYQRKLELGREIKQRYKCGDCAYLTN